MIDIISVGKYSLEVFIVILISGCILNLLKQHYVVQLAGIACFFSYIIFKIYTRIQNNPDISLVELYSAALPALCGISACLISMVLGFWIFPGIRKKFKN